MLIEPTMAASRRAAQRSNSNAETVRDFLIFLLLTGLRRNEAATLKWDEEVEVEVEDELNTKRREVESEVPLPPVAVAASPRGALTPDNEKRKLNPTSAVGRACEPGERPPAGRRRRSPVAGTHCPS
jgi:integrase